MTYASELASKSPWCLPNLFEGLLIGVDFRGALTSLFSWMVVGTSGWGVGLVGVGSKLEREEVLSDLALGL